MDHKHTGTAPDTAPAGIDLDKLEALARAATPGPWQVITDEHPTHMEGYVHKERRIFTTDCHAQLGSIYPVVNSSRGIGEKRGDPAIWMVSVEEANADFIVAANPAAVLQLIALARVAQPAPAVSEQADERALPPLPESKYAADDLADIYTADQMREYARAAIGSASSAPTERLTDDEIKELAQGLYHSDYQGDAHGYDIALARLVESRLARAPASAQPADPELLQALPGCLPDRLFEAISIARDRAEHAGSTPRIKKWDATAADLRAALAAQASSAGAQPVAAAPAGASVKDMLRWSQADTDYHGKIAFTPPQFDHFVSLMRAAPAAPVAQSNHSNYSSSSGATKAARDVLAERRRQVEAEGMTNDGDDCYRAAELPRAAAAYILSGWSGTEPTIWPWAKSWWKPRDARANYVRAGALILAEIERIDRAAMSAKQSQVQELRESAGGAGAARADVEHDHSEGGHHD